MNFFFEKLEEDMTSAISSVTRILTTMCDMMHTVEACEKMFQKIDAGEDSLLEKASLTNRLICLGFTIAEIGMVISGKKSETITFLKGIELIPRFAQLGLSFAVESSEIDGSLKGSLRFVSKGIISPMADVSRVASELTCCDELHYLQMTPEELKNAKRPIYELEGHGEQVVWKIVGYRPVDIEECKKNWAQAQRVSQVAAGIRICIDSNLVEKTVFDAAIPTYQHLYRFLTGNPLNPHHAVPAPGHVAPPSTIGIQTIPNQAAISDLDLRALPRIPQVLHQDTLFQQFVCPITLEPIRDPVKDPTNGITLYERGAILNWLQINQVSPITKQPLSPHQLLPALAAKMLIDNRLEHHRQGLLYFLQQHVNDPIT